MALPPEVEARIATEGGKVTGVNKALVAQMLEPAPVAQPSLFVSRAPAKIFAYTLPWPPSVNTYWTPFIFKPKSGVGINVVGLKGVKVMVRMIMSEKGRDFSQSSRNAIVESGIIPRTNSRLAFLMILYPPTKRPIDLDNRVKGVWDGMKNAGVFVDDSQIDSMHVTRGPVVGLKRARAEVFLKELDEISPPDDIIKQWFLKSA